VGKPCEQCLWNLSGSPARVYYLEACPEGSTRGLEADVLEGDKTPPEAIIVTAAYEQSL